MPAGLLLQKTCGICYGDLAGNGWDGVSTHMTITGEQAAELRAQGFTGIIEFHGVLYAPLPVCTICQHPERAAQRLFAEDTPVVL